MIEAVDPTNLECVLPLIREYQAFYQCPAIHDDVNRSHFGQFGPDSDLGCLFLYREGDRAVAFATVYLTFSSTLPGKVGVMNELYTVESCRGQGVGRQLIECCLAYARAKGALRLQWLTATGNVNAQRLYDSVPARKSDWYFYTYAGS